MEETSLATQIENTPQAKTFRLGIFGGSFDPIHFGHLLLAETCREEGKLDQVWLVPAAVPPHKKERTLTPATQRIEMLQLAIAGHSGLQVSTIEIQRGGVSYTFETLATVQHSRPDAEIFFLMGADSLRDLPTWREPARICELATPLVVRRAGAPQPDFTPLAGLVSPARLAAIRQQQVEMPIVELSSTDIRRRVAAGLSIRYRTPRAVEKYIETNRIYLTK
jgi:nicotinate-nucleotide adenylyltransferase